MHRLALPLWIITVILFFILLKYGAYFLMLTGATMVGANIAWASLRNVNELIIPFSAEHKLEFHFGPCFYVNLVTGLISVDETLFNCKCRKYMHYGYMDTSVHLYIILQMCSEISFKPYIYPFAKLKFTFVISAVRPVWWSMNRLTNLCMKDNWIK